MDLNNTTKRGLFKILPLMLLFIGNTRLLQDLSRRMWKWEGIEMPDPIADNTTGTDDAGQAANPAANTKRKTGKSRKEKS